MPIYNCDNCTVGFNCQNKGKAIAVVNCKLREEAETTESGAPPGQAGFDLLCPEDCILMAVHDGCGESATCNLEVQNQEGDTVAMLKWPEVFGDWQTEEELKRKGFAIRRA